MKTLFSGLFVAVLLAVTISTGGAAGGYTATSVPVTIGQGQVWTFVTLDSSGRSEAVGVRFDEAVLDSLPAEASEYTLQFPAAATGTVFNHFAMDWNPQGHEPPGVYDAAHLDFHFYLVSPEELSLIKGGLCTSAENAGIPNPPGMVPVTCDVLAKAMRPLPVDMLPPDFQLVPAVAPNMGNHLMDPSAPEFNGQPFTQTWIYGAYDGKITFLEPMITKAFLQTRPDVSVPLKTPQAMPEAGWYPTQYSIRFLPDETTFAITLEDFKWFEASGVQKL